MLSYKKTYMAKGQKYSAFSGVFTPSILTILGVIMYMRLGWVVGEAGLIFALGIIVLSHVISVTTGLSISSIATDKKIKTGGIYYILSRSLGMPMGGAIGIALFLGTALSISLYLVGFAESFLAIDAIRDFTGLSADINGFRIVGTGIIILLVIVAFISTSLAMKMQFFILIAIGLSLLSIVLGFFDGPSISTTHFSLSSTGNVPIEYIFAVFFPAVTGFTAGVAMSGDLKDPKKAIPGGTVMAIGVGFVIYVLLAIGMAYFIPRDDLISDYSILSKIAWLGPLVIAGVWGATLSSALGGILGGPRILQAIAKDKMSPKIFGKGYGESNEPRNALLLIFAIAEGGILIGELDVIAGVVSMFYLASYGFINLSYVLEKWASTDFRPTFKIHIGFGIVGFIASFAVMFKLDMLSMFASLLVMGLLYFILKRREIKSESGDVWTSVWASIMRRALASMEGNKMEERNWKPNIILFSGGTKKRPHLLSFGKSLIGNYGVLSNFDMHEKKDSKVLFTKIEQSILEDVDKDRGIFTRRQSCNNIYEGIEMVSQTYGFSGVEPNTILMGWGRQTQDPKRFVQMLNNISDLDLNVLLMDYDKNHGFGEKKQIDIWWRGSGSHGNLSLTLIKFLSNSADWNQAKIRLLIVNYENHKMEMISKRAEEYLENSRIEAELKIINNEIEQKSFYDIMKVESQKSDLVFLGIPDIVPEKEEEFVKSTNDLMLNIGSVILVKASTMFKDLHLGVSDESYNNQQLKELNLINKGKLEDIHIDWPENLSVAHELRQMHFNTEKSYEQHIFSIYNQIQNDNKLLLTQLEGDYLQTAKAIETRGSVFDKEKQIQFISRLRSALLVKINKEIEHYTNNQLGEQSHLLETHLPIFIRESKSSFASLPKQLIIKYTQDKLQSEQEESKAEKRYKWWNRIWKQKEVTYRLKLNKIVNESIYNEHEPFLLSHFEGFGLMQVQFAFELLKISKTIDSSFVSFTESYNKKQETAAVFKQQRELINESFTKLNELNQSVFYNLNQEFHSEQAKNFNFLSLIFNKVHPNSTLKSDYDESPKVKSIEHKLLSIPSLWANNQKLVYNASTTEIRLLSLKSKVKTVLYKLASDVKQKIQSEIIETYEHYLTNIDKKGDVVDLNALSIKNKFDNYFDESFKAFSLSFVDFPEHIKIFESEKLNEFEKKQYSGIQSSDISGKQLIDYLLKSKLESPLIKHQEALYKRISEAIAVLNESSRLITFAQSQDIESLNFEEESSPNELIQQGELKIKNEIESLFEYIGKIEIETDSLYSDIKQSLTYYSFVKTASNLKQYISKQESLSKVEKLKIVFKNGFKYLNEQQANLIYSRSKAFIIKTRLSQKTSIVNPVKALLDITFQLSPTEQVSKKLPFFYRQLFTSNQILHKDFWVGREKEIEQAKQAFERYKSGYKGALGVNGRSGSGKTFFSYYVSEIFDAPKVITVNVQSATSAGEEGLREAFEKAADRKGTIKQIISRLPKNSVIIIDQIEDWGSIQKTKEDLIPVIYNLVKEHSEQVLFIINSNSLSYKHLSSPGKYKNLFIDIIHLENINSKQIKEIILNRHNTSGFKLKLNRKYLDDINENKLARLFNKIQKITNGNIEASLLLWLSLITDYNYELVNVKFPKVDLDNLEVLDIDSQVILKQFVIHKQLTIEVLTEILHEEPQHIKEQMQFLMRSGLIIKHKNHLQQNPYTKYFVNNFLKNKGIL